jgi:hypothetical protein
MEVVYNESERVMRQMRWFIKKTREISFDAEVEYCLSVILNGLDEAIYSLNFLEKTYDQLLYYVSELKILTAASSNGDDNTKDCPNLVQELYDYLVNARKQYIMNIIRNNSRQPEACTIEELKQNKINDVFELSGKADSLMRRRKYDQYIEAKDRTFFACEESNALMDVTLFEYVEESIKRFMVMAQGVGKLYDFGQSKDELNPLEERLQEINRCWKDSPSHYYETICHQLEDIIVYMNALNIGNLPLAGEIQLLLIQLKKEQEVAVRDFLEKKFPDGGYTNSDLLTKKDEAQTTIDSIITMSECERVAACESGFTDYMSLLPNEQVTMKKVNNKLNIAFVLQMAIVGLREYKKPLQLEKLPQTTVIIDQ